MAASKVRCPSFLVGLGLVGAVVFNEAIIRDRDQKTGTQRCTADGASSVMPAGSGKSNIRRERTAEEEAARAQHYFSNGQMDSAREALRAAIEKDPDAHEYRRRLVKLLSLPDVMNHQPGEVLQHLHWLASHDHALAGDYYNLVHFSLMGETTGYTLQTLEDLAMRYPALKEHECYAVKTWELCYRDGDYERVVSEAEAHLSGVGTGSPSLHLVLGLSLEQLGDFGGALDHLRVHYNEGEDGGWSALIEPHIRRLMGKQAVPD